MDGGVLGSDFEGLVEIGDGFGLFAGSVEGSTEIVKGFWKVGLQLERLTEEFDGLVVVFFLKLFKALMIQFGSCLGAVGREDYWCGKGETERKGQMGEP
jgi:hypothetical protein